MSRLSRMLFGEIIPPFLFSFVLLSGLLLLGRLLPLLEPILRVGVHPLEVAKLAVLLVPTFMVFILPMATLLGVLLGFLRLSRDSEMIALLASGIGPSRLLRPVAVFTVCAWILSLYVSVSILPQSKLASKTFMRDLTERALARGLPERVFYTPVSGLTLYVHHSFDGGHRLEGVYIRDARQRQVANQILAQKGELMATPGGGEVVLRLNDGTLSRIHGAYTETDTLDFDSYILKIGLEGGAYTPGRGEMGLSELRRSSDEAAGQPRKQLRFLTEFYKRLALPLGTLVLGMLAAPLGIFFGRTGLSGGIALGLSAFLAYYLSMAFFSNLAEMGSLPPALALGLPNLLFAGLAAFAISLLSRKGPLRG